MPKDTTNEYRQKRAKEHAARMKAWAERAERETEQLIGKIPRPEHSEAKRSARAMTRAALARDMEDAKRVRLAAEEVARRAAVAEKDAQNDIRLARAMGSLSLGKGRGTRRKKGGKTRRR